MLDGAKESNLNHTEKWGNTALQQTKSTPVSESSYLSTTVLLPRGFTTTQDVLFEECQATQDEYWGCAAVPAPLPHALDPESSGIRSLEYLTEQILFVP